LKLDYGQLLALAKQDEGLRVDFKEKIDLSGDGKRDSKYEFAKDCQGFANANGGAILVGVRERPKTVVGIPEPLDRERLIQLARDRSYPPVQIAVGSAKGKDGNYLGLVFVPKSTFVHEMKADGRVYVRRGPITVPASSKEVVQLHAERDRVVLTKLDKPIRPVVEDNRIAMLPETFQHYRKVAKRGYLSLLSQCPVFLPEFSVHISAPKFGDHGSPINVGYHMPRTLTVSDFAKRTLRVEKLVWSMSTYFDSLSRFYWSISEDGYFVYGCGVDNFLRAIKDGYSGVVCFANCGEFRGSPTKGSFILLTGCYCKGPKGDVVATYPAIDLYLSFIPVVSDWIETLFRPFAVDERYPLHSMSYEPANADLKVWAPKHSQSEKRERPQIKGVIRRFKYLRKGDYEIGGVVAGSNWYSEHDYDFKRVMTPSPPSRFDDPLEYMLRKEKYRDNRCPVEVLGETVIALTNPVALYEDVMQSTPTSVDSFTLPLIKQFTVDGHGHTIHILGINGGPDAREGVFSRKHTEEALRRFEETVSLANSGLPPFDLASLASVKPPAPPIQSKPSPVG